MNPEVTHIYQGHAVLIMMIIMPAAAATTTTTTTEAITIEPNNHRSEITMITTTIGGIRQIKMATI